MSWLFELSVYGFIYSRTFQKRILYSIRNKRLMFLAKLARVPSDHEGHLVIKATPHGIVYLKDYRFLKRYIGATAAAVDINGRLFTDMKEYREAVRKEEPPRKIAKGTTKPIECGYKVNKSKVRNRILAMINSKKGERELYFWTITFPEGLSDDLAYRAFNIWLTTLRQRRCLHEYLWVAERQQNGTIHFHIAIPHKMSVVLANRTMRTTLVTMCRKRIINHSVYLIKRYNGVDISKNRKTKRVTNFAGKGQRKALVFYLTKYVTKNDGKFRHFAWHNSRGYACLFSCATFTVPEFVAAGYRELLVPKAVFDTEFFMFFRWKDDLPPPIKNHLYQLNSYIQSVMNN